MSRVKALFFTLFALIYVAIAFTTTSALAVLPDLHILIGESYPVTGEGVVKGAEAVVLETELGEKLVAEEVKMLIGIIELTSLGLVDFHFVKIKEKKSGTLCHTAGDAEGVALLIGEYHVVFLGIILMLISEAVLQCNSEKLKVKVRGPFVLKLEKVTSGIDVTSFGVVAHCTGKGKQELKEYTNDEEKSVKAVLTANFGLGFETGCLNVSEELVVGLSKMVDFLF